jgi:hypothetical protein
MKVILLKHSSDRQASTGINSFINTTVMMKRLLRAMRALKYEKDLKRYRLYFDFALIIPAVNKVRAAQMLETGSGLYTGGVAAEPGLDYKTMDIEGFNGPAEVTVIDYSARKCMTSKKMRMLKDFAEFFQYDRPKWSKVRWINVDGLNWQCIKLLATKYSLHRLAIEDLLSVQRTKIDLYQDRKSVISLLLTTRYLCVSIITCFDRR